jgi:hypothetical protein
MLLERPARERGQMMTEQNLATLQNVWATDGELALSAEAEHDLRTEDYVMEDAAVRRKSRRP